MGSLLIVDGSGVCRAPIVEFTLGRWFADAAWLADVGIESRGLTAEPGRTMCEGAAARLGFGGPAIGFFGAYRALPLRVADVARADLVLTAEREQRSAVVRMLPGTQAQVFTWKEALMLSSVLADRARLTGLDGPADLAELARALHGARGTVPMIEPSTRTGPFHWRRGAEVDPLSIASGHVGDVEHRRITQEAVEVAGALGERFASLLLTDTSQATRAVEPRRWRRRTA